MKKAMNKVMNKANGMLQNARKKAAILSLALSTALIAGSAKLTAFAAEGGGDSSTFDVTTVMQSAVDTTKSQMLSVLAIVVPAIAVVTAAVVGIKFGISWLKKVRG